MKKFPTHLRTTWSGRSDESSIALIITLAVMSLLLVLVLTFATVTRVEIQTSTSNRDLVASKYLAQAALQRAIADIASEYVRLPAATNTGVGSTWSEIVPTNTVAYVTALGGMSTNYVTDIESVSLDPVSGRGITKAGSDGIIDYVALPGNVSNYGEGTPQWIGLKDTNGNLLGRIAFLANGNSLCINAVGNIENNATFAGEPISSRNEGIYIPEVNLVSALVALGWSKTDATNDVGEIMRYRYGPDLYPGIAGLDDDTNNYRFTHDQIDNDGNGSVDVAGEGIDDPEEYLAASDETNAPTITPIGDDRIFTDLKQLHTLTNFSAAMQGRFRSNFSKVQQTFVTQSPIKMDVTQTNLNFTNFQGNQALFYSVITNRLSATGTNGLFAGNVTQQCQVACNIVSFHDTNNIAPFWTNAPGGMMVVGVGEVPHMDEIVYEIIANCRRHIGGGGVTNLEVTLVGSVNAKLWYPYTNNFPRFGGTYACDLQVAEAVRGVSPAPFTAYNNAAASTNTQASLFNTFTAATTVPAITNNAQFLTNRFGQFTIPAGGGFSRDIWAGPAVNVTMSNFDIGGMLRQNAGAQSPLDYWPTVTTPVQLTFSWVDMTNAAYTTAIDVDHPITGYVCFALNDPRVKPTNSVSLTNLYMEYAGLYTQSVTASVHTMGRRNPTNCFIPGVIRPIYNPNDTNADDYLVAGGITNKTFYVPKYGWWKSAAELGRVHRGGTPWQTIDFKGGGKDGLLLDMFTAFKPMTGTNANYRHGLVNLNSPQSQFAVWAALFGGMPLWDGSHLDYDNSGVTSLTKTSNLVSAMTSTKYTTMSSLLNVGALSNMKTNYTLGSWPDQNSDEDKEWFVSHILNLSSTKGSGNFFTVWAWGQSLKGGLINTQKVVAAETLIVAMVKIETVGSNASMRVVYFRYNPDLDFNASILPIEQH